MSGLTFVMLAVVAMQSLGAQPPKPQPKPSTGKVVNVEIIVAPTKGVHEKACQAGGPSPTTVLVTGKQVFHCVKGVLLEHDVDEKKNSDAFKLTLVHVSAGDSIRWFSKANTFRVAQVRLHTPIEKGAPPYPFLQPMPETFTNEVTSAPVRNEPGEIVQQYKVSFDIDKPGNRVDPDVVCSM